MLEVDPITINLAGGHFLKLGMGLQVVEGAHEAPSGAKALDLAISQFSGKTIAELSTAEGREKNKAELTARVKLAYAPHHEEEEETTAETARGVLDEDSEHACRGGVTRGGEPRTEGPTSHGAVLTAERGDRGGGASSPSSRTSTRCTSPSSSCSDASTTRRGRAARRAARPWRRCPQRVRRHGVSGGLALAEVPAQGARASGR